MMERVLKFLSKVTIIVIDLPLYGKHMLLNSLALYLSVIMRE